MVIYLTKYDYYIFYYTQEEEENHQLFLIV